MEATNIILTPPKHDPISITSVYIPPSSDENMFTTDKKNFLQTASNCVLFGDFNATHNAWNCNINTNRGRHLFNFANMLHLNIGFLPTPTRFGHNSVSTIGIALIINFYYPLTINSINDLSSDHNPVFLNFNFKLAVKPSNPRAVSIDWNEFKINLNKNPSLFDYHPNNINNTNDLECTIAEFTDAVIETHSHASRPIEIDRRNFTPQHINLLFNLYINDTPNYSLTKINLYADDTAIHTAYKNLTTISYAINKHLPILQNFYDKWKININVEKSTATIFTKKHSLPPPIIMYNKQIP
ncbi:RNA-directed DNA polymerase from mobile element jockey [Trichonephila clavipes]|nr:RNA-directed DNA polymerase from mobile element jockey [Trichonephila clavipes]